jgi:preprotein translocase subunit SecG
VETILLFAQIALSVAVVLLVLLHSGKDAGLSGAFGVGGSLVERNLDRWTIFFAILFVINIFVLLKFF